MSRWTHVNGIVELYMSPFDRENDTLVLSKFKEQVKECTYNKENNNLHATITSLPLIKEVVNKHLEDLPSGEFNTITDCYLNEPSYSSSSSLFYGIDSALQGELASKLALQCDPDVDPNNLSYDIEKTCEAYLTFKADIRYCSFKDFIDGFNKFMENLYKDEVYCDGGHLIIDDEFLEEIWIANLIFNGNELIIKYEAIKNGKNKKSYKVVKEQTYKIKKG